jgi:hypothetical protein
VPSTREADGLTLQALDLLEEHRGGELERVEALLGAAHGDRALAGRDEGSASATAESHAAAPVYAA